MWRFLRKKMQAHYGPEIPGQATIGEGFYIGHAYGITVNPDAVIGRNCNIHKGVTIGQENRRQAQGSSGAR